MTHHCEAVHVLGSDVGFRFGVDALQERWKHEQPHILQIVLALDARAVEQKRKTLGRSESHTCEKNAAV